MVALIVLVVSIIGLALFAWWVAGGDPLGGSDVVDKMRSKSAQDDILERHLREMDIDPMYSSVPGNAWHKFSHDDFSPLP